MFGGGGPPIGGGGPPGRGAARPPLRRHPARAPGRRRPAAGAGARAGRARRRLHPAADGAREEAPHPDHAAHGVPGHAGAGHTPGRDHRAVHAAGTESRLVRHQPRPDAPPLRLRHRRRLRRALPRVDRGVGWRPVGPGPCHGPPGVVGHERPPGQGLPPPATTLARLLHRGEGRRGHEPHDQRHREPAAAAAGRVGPVRHSGPDDDRHHDLSLPHQRDAGRHHRLRRAATTGHHVVLVQAGLGARLRQGPRWDRAGAGRPLREPAGRPYRHRPQPAALQRRDASGHRRFVPRRQQLHRPYQRHLRAGLTADQRLRPSR